MTRPLSDAKTTFMPELHPPTEPLPRVDTKCGWCGINIGAIPDPPKPYVRPGGTRIEHFHPGCIGAQRNRDAGVSAAVDSLLPGTSDPR